MRDSPTDLSLAKDRASKILLEAFDGCEAWVTDRGMDTLVIHVNKMVFINGEWQRIYANRFIFISELQLKHAEFFHENMTRAIDAIKNQISELIRDRI